MLDKMHRGFQVNSSARRKEKAASAVVDMVEIRARSGEDSQH